jgi:hypothetical protein
MFKLFVSVVFFSCILLMCGSASGQCWKLGTTACSTWGTGPTCGTTACVQGWAGWSCPAGATQVARLVPAGTTVPSCDPVTRGRAGCTTAGQPTTWCTVRMSCANAGAACLRPPGGGPRFCAAATGAFVANVGGLTAAVLTGGNCSVGAGS